MTDAGEITGTPGYVAPEIRVSKNIQESRDENLYRKSGVEALLVPSNWYPQRQHNVKTSFLYSKADIYGWGVTMFASFCERQAIDWFDGVEQSFYLDLLYSHAYAENLTYPSRLVEGSFKAILWKHLGDLELILDFPHGPHFLNKRPSKWLSSKMKEFLKYYPDGDAEGKHSCGYFADCRLALELRSISGLVLQCTSFSKIRAIPGGGGSPDYYLYYILKGDIINMEVCTSI